MKEKVLINDDEIKFLMKTLSFWDKLTEAQQKIVLEHTKPIKYQKGNTIHRGEMDCVGVLLIKSGELRIYMLSDEGKEITLFRSGPGEICLLSASCILENITFDVYIDAEADSEILVIDSKIYKQICSQNIYAENFSNKFINERFSEVMWAMEQILFMSFDKRLAVFLYDETTKNQSDLIELTHEQIAKYVGSAREVVSRMLKYFAKEGIVELSRGGVKILNKDKLKRIFM